MGMFGDQTALAALYSAIESQKRKAKGLFTDPMAHLEQIGGRIKDDPEAFAQQLAGMAGGVKLAKTPAGSYVYKMPDRMPDGAPGGETYEFFKTGRGSTYGVKIHSPNGSSRVLGDGFEGLAGAKAWLDGVIRGDW